MICLDDCRRDDYVFCNVPSSQADVLIGDLIPITVMSHTCACKKLALFGCL